MNVQVDTTQTGTNSSNDLTEQVSVPTNPSPSVTKSNNKINEPLKKWQCSSCTYQNWPKSQHCVMCHLKRVNKTSNPTVSNNNTSTTSPIVNNNVNAPVFKPKEHSCGQQNGGAKYKGSSSAKTSYSLLKTLQIQMDRLFLSACEGVVDGDMTHLHRYINAGGDLTRYLTSDEVQYSLSFLNPTVYLIYFAHCTTEFKILVPIVT